MVNAGRALQVSEQLIGRLLPLLNPFWGMLPRRLWAKTKDFFVYGTEFLPLAANAVSANREIQIQSDSHFVIMAAVIVATSVDDLTTVGPPIPQTARLFDTGSGRELQNHDVHVDNYFGTAILPAYWTYPKLIKAASTFRTELTNLSATAANVRVDFWGFKIFEKF
ncbi:MAG: hypothetical protein V3T65_06880 [Acidobacteriota bacterium]